LLFLWLFSTTQASQVLSYGWPVMPFDQQHPVRAFFCDPRIGDKGGKSFHFGIDIFGTNGTAVYSVTAGKIWREGTENIAVVAEAGQRATGYWHLDPIVVKHGQTVTKHQLIGYITEQWGHVHFADRRDGQYWNPLREGSLTPFEKKKIILLWTKL